MVMDYDRTDEIPVENSDDSLSASELNTEGEHSRRATNWQLSEVRQKFRTGVLNVILYLSSIYHTFVSFVFCLGSTYHLP